MDYDLPINSENRPNVLPASRKEQTSTAPVPAPVEDEEMQEEPRAPLRSLDPMSGMSYSSGNTFGPPSSAYLLPPAAPAHSQTSVPSSSSLAKSKATTKVVVSTTPLQPIITSSASTKPMTSTPAAATAEVPKAKPPARANRKAAVAVISSKSRKRKIEAGESSCSEAVPSDTDSSSSESSSSSDEEASPSPKKPKAKRRKVAVKEEGGDNNKENSSQQAQQETVDGTAKKKKGGRKAKASADADTAEPKAATRKKPATTRKKKAAAGEEATMAAGGGGGQGVDDEEGPLVVEKKPRAKKGTKGQAKAKSGGGGGGGGWGTASFSFSTGRAPKPSFTKPAPGPGDHLSQYQNFVRHRLPSKAKWAQKGLYKAKMARRGGRGGYGGNSSSRPAPRRAPHNIDTSQQSNQLDENAATPLTLQQEQQQPPPPIQDQPPQDQPPLQEQQQQQEQQQAAAAAEKPKAKTKAKAKATPKTKDKRSKTLPEAGTAAHEILQDVFGYTEFREGQEEAVEKVLNGVSSLVILPTGAGKSLCYQLPACMLPGVAIIITPLISLMQDQVQHLPPALPGVYLHANLQDAQMRQITTDLQAGKIKILFVSPERLCTDSFIAMARTLSNISFACVDEAHCLSEWSHNFRPSYLRVNSVLRKDLNVPCILALTATATVETQLSIARLLDISEDNIIQCPVVRPNLTLTVSKELDGDRVNSLLKLIKSPRMTEAHSIIIYVMLQYQTDELAQTLNDHGLSAIAYHGGKNPNERRRLQDMFMKNKVRIVVATVAFGMGLDKPDVRAVIHYSLPGSVEHYVQEVGRAGRDGLPADGHVFLCEQDYKRRRSLVHSDAVDLASVRRLLRKIFTRPHDLHPGASGWMVCLSVDKLEVELDMRKDAIATLLAYLDIHEPRLIQLLTSMESVLRICCYRNTLEELGKRLALMHAVLESSRPVPNAIECEISHVANRLGTDCFRVLQDLLQLQRSGEISIIRSCESFHLRVLIDRAADVDLDALASELYARACRLEDKNEERVNRLNEILSVGAAASVAQCLNIQREGDIQGLQERITEYFTEGSPENMREKKLGALAKSDVIRFLQTCSREDVSGRAVARIFHGIASPRFPADEFRHNRYWKKFDEYDFTLLQQAAEEIILGTQQKNGRRTS